MPAPLDPLSWLSNVTDPFSYLEGRWGSGYAPYNTTANFYTDTFDPTLNPGGPDPDVLHDSALSYLTDKYGQDRRNIESDPMASAQDKDRRLRDLQIEHSRKVGALKYKYSLAKAPAERRSAMKAASDQTAADWRTAETERNKATRSRALADVGLLDDGMTPTPNPILPSRWQMAGYDPTRPPAVALPSGGRPLTVSQQEQEANNARAKSLYGGSPQPDYLGLAKYSGTRGVSPSSDDLLAANQGRGLDAIGRSMEALEWQEKPKRVSRLQSLTSSRGARINPRTGMTEHFSNPGLPLTDDQYRYA